MGSKNVTVFMRSRMNSSFCDLHFKESWFTSSGIVAHENRLVSGWECSSLIGLAKLWKTLTIHFTWSLDQESSQGLFSLCCLSALLHVRPTILHTASTNSPLVWLTQHYWRYRRFQQNMQQNVIRLYPLHSCFFYYFNSVLQGLNGVHYMGTLITLALSSLSEPGRIFSTYFIKCL